MKQDGFISANGTFGKRVIDGLEEFAESIESGEVVGRNVVVEQGIPSRDVHRERFVDGKSPVTVIMDETHDLTNSADPPSYSLPKLPSARRSAIMFTLSRDMLRMPINECDSLTYGDVFYANKLVREAGDDMKQVEQLIRSEHESAANLLTWCRNDVSIALAVANSVARLRNAIVMILRVWQVLHLCYTVFNVERGAENADESGRNW